MRNIVSFDEYFEVKNIRTLREMIKDLTGEQIKEAIYHPHMLISVEKNPHKISFWNISYGQTAVESIRDGLGLTNSVMLKTLETKKGKSLWSKKEVNEIEELKTLL